ncbi:RDD family protein [Kitasatospora sp. RG8]|uniref:RDD family protein n=1 Tax=Kitasatospora sp. RG8 TaxID=2820815 RepID=UPI001AE05F52|nr:RDD family protein [Kitasatospora sp. RG8]MBP0454349.1 RDD family protein [Kitasatospora sp. RG8]
MTDQPFAGGADTAVDPAPGYYPDPSIPGFVRYWGGTAWVPGTSRPSPAEGEVLQPPRFVARRGGAAGGAGGAGVGARYVPPPAVPAGMEEAEGGAAQPAPGGAAAVVERAPERVPERVPEPASDKVAEVAEASSGETGPVYLDQTAGGASFTFGPQLAAGGTVFRPEGADDAAGAAGAAGWEAVRETVREVGPAGEAQAGWQVDPQAQRGLMETGGAPRWVSWGVLPGAEQWAEASRVEPSRMEASRVEAVRTEAFGAEASRGEASRGEVGASVAGPAVAAEAAVDPAPVPAAVRVTVPMPVPVTGPVAGPEPEQESAPGSAADVAPESAPGPAVEVAPAPARAAVPARAAAPAARAARPVPGPRPATRRRPASPVPAGLGRRLAARLVDTAVLAVVATAAAVPLGNSVRTHLQDKLDQARMASSLTRRQVDVWLVDGVVVGKFAVLVGILAFVGLLYEVLPTARTGQTFGKRLARIRVIDAAPSAARVRLTVGRSLCRWLVRNASAVLLLGLVWPVFDRPAGRGWHDRAARTRVVRS